MKLLLRNFEEFIDIVEIPKFFKVTYFCFKQQKSLENVK